MISYDIYYESWNRRKEDHNNQKQKNIHEGDT